MTIDQNSRSTLLGVIHGTRTVIPAGITDDNKLLIEIIPVGSFGSAVGSTTALKIDENSRHILGGIDSGNIYPVVVDEINNLPVIRVELI